MILFASISGKQAVHAGVQPNGEGCAKHGTNLDFVVQVLREGDSIVGQMHREGLESDNIKAVGLYYPDVDAELKGGVLELTRVMTGGCGSRYPRSTEVPIQKGSAVVFENMDTFHRMTTLMFEPKSAASDKTLERTVVAFFLQKGA